jgi:long-chain fatty acid transport protein
MLQHRLRVARAARLGLALCAAPTLSHASGFAIFEQGANGMGFAGAYTAQSDPSSIFHNAAGVAFLKGTHLALGGTLIAPSTDFTGADPFPGASVTETGDAGVIVPPAFDLTHQLSENLVVGFGVHVPFGLRTRWADADTTFTGRFISKRADVRAFSFNPTVAYKLADRLAVGGGIDVRLTKVQLDRNVASINPFTLKPVDVAAVTLASDQALDFGFNLGVLAKPTERLSIGVAYRHKVQVDFTGNANFTRLPTGSAQFDALVAGRLPAGDVPISTDIAFPALISLGGAYEWEQWTLAAQLDLQQWSSFDELPITVQDRPDLSSVSQEQYQNSQIYRVGLERRFGENLSVRGGYFYDKSPVPAPAVSPLLPDADRHGICVGFGYRSGKFKIDVANWFLIFKDRSTEGVNRDHYDGVYKSRAELFAVTLGWVF